MRRLGAIVILAAGCSLHAQERIHIVAPNENVFCPITTYSEQAARDCLNAVGQRWLDGQAKAKAAKRRPRVPPSRRGFKYVPPGSVFCHLGYHSDMEAMDCLLGPGLPQPWVAAPVVYAEGTGTLAPGVSWETVTTTGALFFPSNAGGQVEVAIADPFVKISDRMGAVILAVYRDGHVVAADPSKIDAAAKEFWTLLAKYMPELCASPQKAGGK